MSYRNGRILSEVERIPKRVKVKLAPLGKEFVPFNYQHLLMGLIYNLLSEVSPSFAENLHKSSSPKPFTFSWIRGKPSHLLKNGLIFENPVKIIFSSYLDEFVENLSYSLLNRELLSIGNAQFAIEELQVYEREIKSPARFISLSPIVVSRGVKINGKLYHEFLSPEDPEFSKRLSWNLEKKYKLMTGKEAKIKIEVDIDYVKKNRTSKLVDIKGTKIKAHMVPLHVEGDEEIVEFGYYAGFGERTAQGFGCVELKED